MSDANESEIPRNRGQINDIKRHEFKNKEHQSFDPLLDVFKLSQTNKNFVPVAGIEEGCAYAVVVFPKLCQHITQILDNKDPVVIHHDTTFNVGRFYATIVLFKHPYIEGLRPIPFAFLFHQKKDTIAHVKFMEVVVAKVPKLNSQLVTFVTDREVAIKNAIQAAAPEAFKANCHAHIMTVNIFKFQVSSLLLLCCPVANKNTLFVQNIDNWHPKEHMSSLQRAHFKRSIKQLLNANSETDFIQIEENLLSEGGLLPRSAILYYQRCLQKDVRGSSKFRTEPLGVFYPGTGVNNNPRFLPYWLFHTYKRIYPFVQPVFAHFSENMNYVYKHFSDVAAGPKEWIEAIDKAYLLMADKYNDIYCAVEMKMGDFRCLPEYYEKLKRMKMPKEMDALGDEGIMALFTHGKYVHPTADRSDIDLERVKYNDGLADFFTKTNRVEVVHGQFFVNALMEQTHKVISMVD